MESKFILGYVAVVIFMVTLSSSEARRFNVGERDGWVVNPRESFNHWAERNRFQINDTLVFRYNKGNDLVLVVTQTDYNNCSVTRPLQAFNDGNSVFRFTRPGPFYFISGNAEHCGRGQKLIVVVLSPRHRAGPLPSTPPASPASSAATPPSAAEAPAPSPVSASPVDQPAASPSSGDSTAPTPAPEGSSAPGFGTSAGLAVSLVVTSFFRFALI